MEAAGITALIPKVQFRKHHIWPALGCWWCADARWLGWGLTWRDAYDAWANRSRNSCVHQRATPLDKRREVK